MEENLKKTCLYDSHVSLGALMSPFGGFMMPIQYSDIITEHNAVRKEAGMFDVSHMGEFTVSGPDAEKFVNHVFTNDIASAPAGKIFYGMLLRPDGGVVDDLLVYCPGDGTFFLVVNAANIDKDYDWVCSQAAGYDVEIANESDSYGEIALQGPKAEQVVRDVLGLDMSELGFYTFTHAEILGENVLVSRTGYTGEDGFEFYGGNAFTVKLWEELLKAGVQPCGLGCRDTLRFEVGLPLYGHELADDITPIEACLGIFVKLDKEEFIGKEACAAQKENGAPRKIVGIELDDKAVPRAGYPVETLDGREIGHVTTGYNSISTGKSVCMAIVEKAESAMGARVQVRIRKKVFTGTICKKRFYDKNYKK